MAVESQLNTEALCISSGKESQKNKQTGLFIPSRKITINSKLAGFIVSSRIAWATE